MPLIIPKTLPAYDALYEENVFVMGEILSHDFVESALMLKAGYGVWLAYEVRHLQQVLLSPSDRPS